MAFFLLFYLVSALVVTKPNVFRILAGRRGARR